MSVIMRDLHGALIDIVSAMNRPQRDEAMVREAGIPLDRTLFPLLVAVERRGPIGVVKFADGVGATTRPSAGRSRSWKASASSAVRRALPTVASGKPSSRRRERP